ncbi:MAG: hypothetical protein ACOC2H_10180 [Spirochaetota bacterium]
MKKCIAAIALVISLASCEKSTQKKEEQDSQAIQSVLETWQYAIRERSYKLYAQTKLNPADRETFMTEYSSAYFNNIIIMSQTPAEKKIIDGGEYFVKEVTVGAEVISRSDPSQKGMVNGEISVVRPAHEDSSWKIHNTTLVWNM